MAFKIILFLDVLGDHPEDSNLKKEFYYSHLVPLPGVLEVVKK
jgi:hypothetical protein